MGHSAEIAPWLVSVIGGGIAGGVEAAVTYPVEFVKTQVQLHHEKGRKPPTNPFLAVRSIWRQQGLRAMYKGCETLVVGSIAKDAIRFLSFSRIKATFASPETHTLTPLGNMAAGVASGVIASTTAVTPAERIKTALIDDSRLERRFRSPLHAVRTIYAETGFLGLYRGYTSTTLKQVGATAFRLGSYNTMKDLMVKHDIPQGPVVSFVTGAMAGTITTFATQPFDVVKTRSQSARGCAAADAVSSVWADEGLRGFWRGTMLRLGRTVFSGAILFTVYEGVVSLSENFAKLPRGQTME